MNAKLSKAEIFPSYKRTILLIEDDTAQAKRYKRYIEEKLPIYEVKIVQIEELEDHLSDEICVVIIDFQQTGYSESMPKLFEEKLKELDFPGDTIPKIGISGVLGIKLMKESAPNLTEYLDKNETDNDGNPVFMEVVVKTIEKVDLPDLDRKLIAIEAVMKKYPSICDTKPDIDNLRQFAVNLDSKFLTDSYDFNNLLDMAKDESKEKVDREEVAKLLLNHIFKKKLSEFRSPNLEIQN